MTIITNPDGTKYCCEELASMDITYGDGRITHQTDNWYRNSDPDHWYLKFFESAYPGCDVAFDFVRINYCPFCGSKVPV